MIYKLRSRLRKRKTRDINIHKGIKFDTTEGGKGDREIFFIIFINKNELKTQLC